MVVTSVLEIYTVFSAWMFSNLLFDVLRLIIILPFIVMIIRNVAAAHRSAGFRSGIDQAISSIEVDFVAMMVVVLFGFIPFFPLEISSLSYEPPEVVFVSEPVPPQIDVTNDPTQYSDTLNPIVQDLSNQLGDVEVPIAMFLFMRVSYGINHALSKGILDSASRNDLQAAKLAMSKFKIGDASLTEQFRQFGSDCYNRARSRFYSWSQDGSLASRLSPAAIAILEDNPEDVTFYSSEVFQLTPGLYAACPNASDCNTSIRSTVPIEGFPYNAARDGQRLEEADGTPGQPFCLEWWESIRNDINADSPEAATVWDTVQMTFGTFGARDEDLLAERIIRNTFDEAGNLGGQSYGAFNDTETGIIKTVASGISALRLAAANEVATFENFPIRESVAIILSILIMLVIVYSPLILYFRGFSWIALIQIAGYLFAVITAHSTLTLITFAETALYNAIFGDNSFFTGLVSIGQQSFKFTFTVIYPSLITLHLVIFGLITNSVVASATSAGSASTGSRTQGNLAARRNLEAANRLRRSGNSS